jgi:hypothetical protein
MQEIKLSLEIPTKHLDQLSQYTDLDFPIAHLVLEDKLYREFYHERVARGHTVLLDNGLFELDQPLDTDTIIQAAKLLCFEHQKPIIIAPDYYCEKDRTCSDSFKMLREGLSYGFKVGCVPQGKTYAEVIECYRELSKAPFEPLCLSFLNPRYDILLNMPLMYNRWHHLLGLYNLEEIRWLRTFIPFPKLLSIDTNKPIKAAQNGLTMREAGRGMGRWKHNAAINDIGQAVANILDLRMYCQGLIEPHRGMFDIPQISDRYWEGSFHNENPMGQMAGPSA